MPLKAGTLNLMGIIGLSESIEFLEQMGIESTHAKEMVLLNKLRDGLSLLDGIELYCTENFPDHVGLLTSNIRGMDPNDAGAILDGDFGIAVRVGLHCAPLVHESLGTSPYGSIRFSIGLFNASDEIDHVLKAMADIVRYGNR